MKVSNETKIGALTVIAVTLLIVGFDFLKGKSLFKTGNYLYARYSDTKSLMPSNAVFINGYQVGTVSDIETADKNLREIIVTIKLKDAYNIPDNSVAMINGSVLSSPSITIKLGNSTSYLESGDTLKSINAVGIMENLSEKLSPVTDQLVSTLASLDSVLMNVNAVLNPNTKNNIQGVIANLNKTTANLVGSSASLQKMLNMENGSIVQSLSNVDSFTKNLAANNSHISQVIANMETTTDNLAKADIDGVVSNLKTSSADLSAMLAKLNSGTGSLGSLINDKSLFTNLNNTINSLHILMDDLRVHPKRYVNVSIFGKKDKGDYLTSPLKKDSTSTPLK